MNPRVNAMRSASALAALALGTGVAMAATEAPVAKRVVTYAELNLSSAQGVATLYRRITRAAEEVCGPADQPGSRFPAPGYRECVARAVSEAIRDVHRPELSAYHAQKQHLARLPANVIARR